MVLASIWVSEFHCRQNMALMIPAVAVYIFGRSSRHRNDLFGEVVRRRKCSSGEGVPWCGPALWLLIVSVMLLYLSAKLPRLLEKTPVD